MNDAPEFSPDGQFLAHLRDRGHRVVLRELQTEQEREFPLPSTVTAVGGALDFCPDGRSLLVTAYSQPHALALHVQLERGGVEQIIMGPRPSRPVCVGDAMIYVRHDANDSAAIVRRSFAAGQETILLRGPSSLFVVGGTGGLYRSPHADRIAFTERTDSERVFVMPARGGAPKAVASSPLVRVGPQSFSEIQSIMWSPRGEELLLVRSPITSKPSDAPEVAVWRVPLDGGKAIEAARMQLPAYKGGVWGSRAYTINPSGTRIAFVRSAGFVAQEWAIDNLLQFIKSGRSVVVPVRQ